MPAKTLGIVIIIIGIIMVAYTGFNFVTSKKVVDIGSIKIEKEANHPVQWSPIVGVVLIVGGIPNQLRFSKNENRFLWH